jgi:Protein of unknown function (DUF1553)/Protein of unknown function (DUF1549)/Concanavalin A-like lectin/glucanases superfamily/Planctomycete cytochrome C
MRLFGLFLFSCSTACLFATDKIEFNRDIRPILSDKCFSCHGPDPGKRITKMRLDTETGAKSVITPGNPDHSEVYRRVSSANPGSRMPPAYAGKEKLTEQQITLIRQWIEQGAAWQPHWSFIQPKKGTLNSIDAFVVSRLAREGLHPSPEADRATLIRRVSLDLTGLPPTVAEVADFLNDRSPDAWEKVVDRLLASPRYGERMAFRWMEAARYADTNGYQSDGVREMWRWRDWVIDAYNHNMPFDQFTVEQLAGDLLPNPTLDQRIATAFHRNNRTSAEGGIVPEEFRISYVADRAETTSNVWLGLTLGCARCHDHKYDPITQKDFYSFFAYFNNVPERGLVYNWGNDDPLIKAPTPQQQATLTSLDQKVKAAQARIDALQPLIESTQAKWEKKSGHPDWTVTEDMVYRQPSGETKLLETEGEFANFEYTDPFTFAAWVKPDSPNGAILSHAEDFPEGKGHGVYLVEGKLRLHVIFRWTDIGMRIESAAPLKLHDWQHLMVTYDGSHKAAGVRMFVDGRQQDVKILMDDLNWPMKFKAPFRIGAGAGLFFDGAIRDVRVYKTALSQEQLSIILVPESIESIARLPQAGRTAAQSAKLHACFLETAAPRQFVTAREELAAVTKSRDTFYQSIPTLMVMEEGPPRETHILKRGAYDAPGETVAAAVPAVMQRPRPDWPNNRLGLSKWLVDRANPLTARVTVNRFWQMYFGVGLVKTVEDFGSQGELPMYQDLLDWLAVDFMDSGWDVKALQKTIVMSGTYRQSSIAPPYLQQRDPENRLLARGPRVRLGPDMIRDQALAASGLLVEKVGGPSVKPYQPPGLWQELAGGKGYQPDSGDGLYRRSLYTYWRRTVAPPFMVNFDSPNRETCTVNETRTNTPLQALNLMNDEAFLEASRKLAERLIHEGGNTPESRIDYAYKLTLARPATPAEQQLLRASLTHYRHRYEADPPSARAFIAYGKSPRDPAIASAELAAWTAISNIVLNLDETVTKQ